MNPAAKRIIRCDRIDGILHALWDDGQGHRYYMPVEDETGEPNF